MKAVACTPSQVAMAWLRERAARSTTALLPIIGPRTLQQLDDYLAALEVKLAPEQLARLSEVSRVALGGAGRLGGEKFRATSQSQSNPQP